MSDEDFDLVTHSEVDIAAPASAIWPLILEPTAWKQGLPLTRVDGPRDAVGERRLGYGPDGGVALIVDTVALDPERRMVVKLTTESGLGSGWAAWFLTEHDGVTTVGYDVYAAMRTAGGYTVAAYIAMNQERFDRELVGLRDLVLSRSGPQADGHSTVRGRG